MSLKGMNDYKIFDEYAIIYIKNNKQEVFSCFVDLEDLEKLSLLNFSWHLFLSSTTKTYYAKTTLKNGKKKTLYMHRVILDVPDNMYIDHINHNTLDNRKKNLRIVDNVLNNINRNGLNSNNTSGYRNVSFINGFWRVQLQVNGKNKLFSEKFEDVNKAGEFAKNMRENFYGELFGQVE